MVNRVVQWMIYSDLLVIGAAGFVNPLLAVFVTKQIEGADLATVGFSTMVYWVVKSLAQLPIARSLDAHKGERDDFWSLFFGTVASGLMPLGFLFATQTWHIYALQALSGLSVAFVFPAYSALFTRHIDRHREGYEWALHSLAIGFGYAATSAAAGVLAELYGFHIIFILGSLLIISGAFLLLMVRGDIVSHRGERSHLVPEPDRNGRRKI